MKTVSAVLTSALFASATAVASEKPVNLPAPTAGVQAFLNVLNAGDGKPMEQMTPQEARQVLIGAQKGVTLPSAQVAEKIITVNGQSIKLKIVKPDNATGTLPVFMFFHGGGWVLGDFPTHERLIRDLVRSRLTRRMKQPNGWLNTVRKLASMAAVWAWSVTASGGIWWPPWRCRLNSLTDRRSVIT